MHKHHHKHVTPAQSGPTGTTPVAPTAVAAGDKDHSALLASADAIRLCAYRKWESAGKPAGDGVQFWLQAEHELAEEKNATVVQGDGWRGDRDLETREAAEKFKAANASVDSHYRDNNRMFQSHGDRGHRHGVKRE